MTSGAKALTLSSRNGYFARLADRTVLASVAHRPKPPLSGRAGVLRRLGMRTDHSRLRRPGIAAATAALVAVGIVGGVSVAGARENITLYSVEAGSTGCYSLDKNTPCVPGTKP